MDQAIDRAMDRAIDRAMDRAIDNTEFLGVFGCLHQETDENLCPLLKPADCLQVEAYEALRDFLGNRIDKQKLISRLHSAKVPDDAIFSDEFQKKINRHHLDGGSTFNDLRQSLFRFHFIIDQPKTASDNTSSIIQSNPQEHKRSPKTSPRDNRSIPHEAHYEPLPLQIGRNALLQPKIDEFREKKINVANKLLYAVRNEPMIAPNVRVLAKSSIDRIKK